MGAALTADAHLLLLWMPPLSSFRGYSLASATSRPTARVGIEQLELFQPGKMERPWAHIWWTMSEALESRERSLII